MSIKLRKEEENFIRLVRVIVKDVRSKLLRLFLSEFESKYRRPYENDAASGMYFLNQIQNQCRDLEVQGKIQHGDSTDFDITTLCYCLVTSGALILPRGSSKLIKKLRRQRNLLSHAINPTIDETDFNTRVNELETIYQQLGWSLDDLLKEIRNPLITTAMANYNARRQILQTLKGK